MLHMLAEPMPKAPLTIKDTASRLGVSEATLRRWDRAGRFCARRHPINNYRLYDVPAVERLARELAGVGEARNEG
jgi:DNA-binding transcriptional MerR regulator